jgi:tRNA(Ile2) C34 agmatinyltransferase TiaS
MKTKEELIFQALGAASMCWTGTPSGTFDSTRCKQIGDELIAALEKMEALKPSYNNESTPPCPQCKSPDTGYRCCSCGTEFGADDD